MVNPTVYAAQDSHQKRNVKKLIDEYAEKLMTISGMCMDIGCGPGDITKSILLPAVSANATMIGADISVEMVSYANEVHADKKRLAFEVLDIGTENLPEKYVSQFRHIFSFHTLQWCDVQQAFENIYKMLQRDGSVLTFFLSYSDLYETFKILSERDCFTPYVEYIGKSNWQFQYSARPQKELRDVLESIGFEVDHCSNREIVNVHTLDSFLPGIMACLPFIKKMPQDLAEKFIEEFKREYLKKKILSKRPCDGGEEETIIIDIYYMLFVYAKKPNL